MMSSHILFKSIDNKNPVTLSQKFLSELLRQRLQFTGLIVSDDLDMKALTKYQTVEDIPVAFFAAGGDIALYCNEPDSPRRAIESVQKALEQGKLSEAELSKKVHRVLEFKKTQLDGFGRLRAATKPQCRFEELRESHQELRQALDKV